MHTNLLSFLRTCADTFAILFLLLLAEQFSYLRHARTIYLWHAYYISYAAGLLYFFSVLIWGMKHTDSNFGLPHNHSIPVI